MSYLYLSNSLNEWHEWVDRIIVPLQINLDYNECLRDLFAGTTRNKYRRPRRSFISTKDMELLAQIGILVKEEETRSCGLVHLNTIENFDIVHFKALLDQQIDQATEEGETLVQLQKLVYEYESTVEDLQEVILTSKNEMISSVLDEQNFILTCIGCLVLPSNFLSNLEDAALFIENTAPLLGKYVLATLKETGCFMTI